jgi:hypothetical protein
MLFSDLILEDEIRDIESHLRDRGLDLKKTSVVLDKDKVTANFFLYNLSGKLVGYQRYNPNGTKKTSGNVSKDLWKYFTYASKEDTGSSIAVYGLDTYDMKSPILWITEGVFDVNKLHNAGQSGIAVLTNKPGKAMKSWLRTLPQKKIVIYDNDAAGKKLRSVADFSFTVPEGYKDLGEMPQSEVNEFVEGILTQIGNK